MKIKNKYNYIEVFNRKLSINNIIDVIDEFDSSMLDVLFSTIAKFKKERIIYVLKKIHDETGMIEQTHMLFKYFDVNIKVIESLYEKIFMYNEHNHVGNTNSEYESINNDLSYELSQSPNILPSKNYETNRDKRELGEITDVPSVDFDMPTVPDLPKL